MNESHEETLPVSCHEDECCVTVILCTAGFPLLWIGPPPYYFIHEYVCLSYTPSYVMTSILCIFIFLYCVQYMMQARFVILEISKYLYLRHLCKSQCLFAHILVYVLILQMIFFFNFTSW